MAKKTATTTAAVAPTPTDATYGALNAAYDHFNKVLFAGKLPACLLTLRGVKTAYGYFWAERFTSTDKQTTHEIALNPAHFARRSDKETLGTLVHEMVHLEQQVFGRAPKRAYHNKEWAEWMLRVGLHPSTTGKPGGKQTGAQCSHYIIDGGAFDVACDALLATGIAITWRESAGISKEKATKSSKRAKYTCPDCGLNAWAKFEAKLVCGECHVDMEEDS